MILRRIADAAVEQNWFIVFIEVLVVVVGIFLGFQVDDWNESRKDRQDEQLFLTRLHGDILLATELSRRVRDRRLGRLQWLNDAADVLFGRAERDLLNEDECIAIASAKFFNINVSSLSSFTELAGTGRMDIIQDVELRTALVELQQTRAALAALIILHTTSAANAQLPINYPDLIQLISYFDSEQGEVRSRPQCDEVKMRANQTFLNDFSVNIDRYDAYIRDGLAPWSAQFDKVHQLVDDALGISHEPDDTQ